MIPRNLIIAVSALALLAGAGIVIIALALVGGDESTSDRTTVAASPTPTLAPATVTPTPEPRATRPPTPTTIGAAIKPTFTPTVPAPPTTPTPPPRPPTAPPTPPDVPPPAPPASRPELPDLALLDLAVSGDRVSAVVGNVGEQAVPAGATVELALRGALAGSSTLPQGLSAPGNFSILLGQEFIYRPESVTAVVDPNNLIPEANEANNTLTRQLEPDILLDLALTGLNAAGADEHLSVSVRNNSPVPARQVMARLSVYRSDSNSLLSSTIHQLNLEPQGTISLTLAPSGLRGLSLRAVLEVMGIMDGNPANNVLNSTIP